MMTESDWKAFERRHKSPWWARTPYDIAAMRAKLHTEQDGICSICGEVVNADPELDNGASLDHTIPRRRGGDDRVGNLTMAHKLCNHRKGHRAPTGCECVWLLAVNARLGVLPQVF